MISIVELRKGCQAYWDQEPRDAMYRVAIDLVTERWAHDAGDVADGLGVILLTWNHAAYRYDAFDFGKLEEFLRVNRPELDAFRKRSITSFQPNEDSQPIKAMFGKTMDALVTTKNKKRSPVGVAKALHIIAPQFFPLWDVAIATGWNCLWSYKKDAASQYVEFTKYAQAAAAALDAEYGARSPAAAKLPVAPDLASALSELCRRPKSLLKFIDEYCFAKYTKKWI
jgi:hypothetical protein